MVTTKGGAWSVAGSMFWDSDFRKKGRMSVCGIESFKLGRGLEVDIGGGDDVNGQDGVNTNMNGVPGAPYHIRVQKGIRMLKGGS